MRSLPLLTPADKKNHASPSLLLCPPPRPSPATPRSSATPSPPPRLSPIAARTRAPPSPPHARRRCSRPALCWPARPSFPVRSARRRAARLSLPAHAPPTRAALLFRQLTAVALAPRSPTPSCRPALRRSTRADTVTQLCWCHLGPVRRLRPRRAASLLRSTDRLPA
jgi:hypothetical protein